VPERAACLHKHAQQEEGPPRGQGRETWGYGLEVKKESVPLTRDLLNHRADDKTAEEYALEGGATLHLVLALRGGAN
jgi:thiamine monophosphate kinase